jgi:hypothetical protein
MESRNTFPHRGLNRGWTPCRSGNQPLPWLREALEPSRASSSAAWRWRGDASSFILGQNFGHAGIIRVLNQLAKRLEEFAAV